jgi:predicted transcriptional regulator
MPLQEAVRQARRKAKKAPPPGGLLRDLYETKRDIRRHLKGIPGEASLEEMMQTKKRIRREILEEERKEMEDQIRQANPRQLSPIHAKPPQGWA